MSGVLSLTEFATSWQRMVLMAAFEALDEAEARAQSMRLSVNSGHYNQLAVVAWANMYLAIMEVRP